MKDQRTDKCKLEQLKKGKKRWVHTGEPFHSQTRLEIAVVAVSWFQRCSSQAMGAGWNVTARLCVFLSKFADNLNFWLRKVWIVVLHINFVKLKNNRGIWKSATKPKNAPFEANSKSAKPAHCSVTVHCTDSSSSAASSRVKTEMWEQSKAENSKIVYSWLDFMNTRQYFEP